MTRVLEMKGIVKAFSGQTVLHSVEFEVMEGEHWTCRVGRRDGQAGDNAAIEIRRFAP
jgi:ABC-type branched-subunit amino acid transport system ATPase component